MWWRTRGVWRKTLPPPVANYIHTNRLLWYKTEFWHNFVLYFHSDSRLFIPAGCFWPEHNGQCRRVFKIKEHIFALIQTNNKKETKKSASPSVLRAVAELPQRWWCHAQWWWGPSRHHCCCGNTASGWRSEYLEHIRSPAAELHFLSTEDTEWRCVFIHATLPPNKEAVHAFNTTHRGF